VSSTGDTVIDGGDRRSWIDRWAPIGGLAFVVGWIVMFLNPAISDTGDTPAEVVANATDEDTWLVISTILVLVMVITLVWFVSGIAARVSRVAGTAEVLAVGIAGAAFTILSTTALTIWVAPLVDIEDDAARALVQAEAYLMIDDVGWFLLGASGVAAGVMIVAASLATRRAAGVPSWLTWLGVLAGVLSLATVAFFGIFAWLAWIAVASILLLIRQA
jgi:uncharacterized membrane protein YgdD (TMEM256/DUF423 family)